MSEQLTLICQRAPRWSVVIFSSPIAMPWRLQIEDCENWPQNKHLLVGPKGSGKTHLANVWANQRGTRVIAATDITDQSVEEYAAHDLVIDDIPTLLGDASREATLFHIHNRVWPMAMHC